MNRILKIKAPKAIQYFDEDLCLALGVNLAHLKDRNKHACTEINMLSLLLVPEYEGSGEVHQKIQKYVKKNGESFDLEQLKKDVNKSRKQKIYDVQNLYAQLGLELKLPDEHILRDDNNILYKHTFMLNLRKEVDIFACNAI